MIYSGYSKRLEGLEIFLQSDSTHLKCFVYELDDGSFLFQHIKGKEVTEKTFLDLEKAFDYGSNKCGVVSYYSASDMFN